MFWLPYTKVNQCLPLGGTRSIQCISITLKIWFKSIITYTVNITIMNNEIELFAKPLRSNHQLSKLCPIAEMYLCHFLPAEKD